MNELTIKENLPDSKKLPISRLSAIFSDTTNSYKFYWFLSILNFIEKPDFPLIRPVISIQSLCSEMMSQVWYPLEFFKLSFGTQDSFTKLSQKMKLLKSERKELSDKSFEEELKHYSSEERKKIDSLIYQTLKKNVPFRFLAPFLKNSISATEGTFEKQIARLSNEHFGKDMKPVYRLGENSIELDPDWTAYFLENSQIIRGFIYWHLLKFLQKRNENVTGISEKLFKPESRDLRTARIFWTEYLNKKQVIHCIYSGEKVNLENISLDHFIPWKYTVHDKLWNIIPTTVNMNSQKSDRLPKIETFFQPFAEIQYDALYTILENDNSETRKLTSDYCDLFLTENLVKFKIEKDQFTDKLKDTIVPMRITAHRMGFEDLDTVRDSYEIRKSFS